MIEANGKLYKTSKEAIIDFFEMYPNARVDIKTLANILSVDHNNVKYHVKKLIKDDYLEYTGRFSFLRKL